LHVERTGGPRHQQARGTHYAPAAPTTAAAAAPTSLTATSTATTTTAAAVGKKGGTLTYADWGDATTIDPAFITNQVGRRPG